MKSLIVAMLLLVFFQCKAQTVRNFALKDISNNTITLSEVKGSKLTVLDFWATWCKPCIKMMPVLNKLSEEYAGKGVAFAGINCDGPRSSSKVIPIVKSLGITYPVLLDINSDVFNSINATVIPTLVLINDLNEIVWMHEGYVAGDEADIKMQIEKYLQNK